MIKLVLTTVRGMGPQVFLLGFFHDCCKVRTRRGRVGDYKTAQPTPREQGPQCVLPLWLLLPFPCCFLHPRHLLRHSTPPKAQEPNRV